MMVLNRRAKAPGAEEQHRHMKRHEQDELVGGHRSGQRRHRLGDAARHREQPPAGGEVVATRATPVAPWIDARLPPPRREQRRAGPQLGLGERRRVRRKAALARARLGRTIRAELDLVEHALAEAAEPAVQRRPVQRRKAGGCRPQAPASGAVGRDRRRDDRQRVGLVRKHVSRKHADAPAASPTARHGEPDRALRTEHDAAPHPRSCQGEVADLAAAGATHRREVTRDLVAALSQIVGVGIMKQWYGSGDGFVGEAVSSGHARVLPSVPFSSPTRSWHVVHHAARRDGRHGGGHRR